MLVMTLFELMLTRTTTHTNLKPSADQKATEQKQLTLITQTILQQPFTNMLTPQIQIVSLTYRDPPQTAKHMKTAFQLQLKQK